MNIEARNYLRAEFKNSIISDQLGYEGAQEWADEILEEIEDIFNKPKSRVSQPTVGRTVHYQHDNVTLASIVTNVPELLSEQPNSGPEGYVKAVNLVVFSDVGFLMIHGAPYSEHPQNGHWSWPSRS